MFAKCMVESLESRQFFSAAPAAGDLSTESPPPQPIALLLPAVQAAREAGRRASTSPPPAATSGLAAVDDSPSTQAQVSCQNNLKQIGIAIHN